MFKRGVNILATASLGLFGVNLLEAPAGALVQRMRPRITRRGKKVALPNAPTGRYEKQYRLKGIRP